MKHNKLSVVASSRLYNYLDKNKERAKIATAVVLAEEASKELGFPISEANIHYLRKEMGLTPARGPKSPSPQIETRIELIAREIIRIQVALNNPISEPFRREFAAFL